MVPFQLVLNYRVSVKSSVRANITFTNGHVFGPHVVPSNSTKIGGGTRWNNKVYDQKTFMQQFKRALFALTNKYL